MARALCHCQRRELPGALFLWPDSNRRLPNSQASWSLAERKGDSTPISRGRENRPVLHTPTVGCLWTSETGCVGDSLYHQALHPVNSGSSPGHATFPAAHANTSPSRYTVQPSTVYLRILPRLAHTRMVEAFTRSPVAAVNSSSSVAVP